MIAHHVSLMTISLTHAEACLLPKQHNQTHQNLPETYDDAFLWVVLSAPR